MNKNRKPEDAILENVLVRLLCNTVVQNHPNTSMDDLLIHAAAMMGEVVTAHTGAQLNVEHFEASAVNYLIRCGGKRFLRMQLAKDGE